MIREHTDFRTRLGQAEKAIVELTRSNIHLFDILERLVVGLEEEFLTERLIEVEAFNDARELVE